MLKDIIAVMEETERIACCMLRVACCGMRDGRHSRFAAIKNHKFVPKRVKRGLVLSLSVGFRRLPSLGCGEIYF